MCVKYLTRLFRSNRLSRFCTRCLKEFSYERALINHRSKCLNMVDPENLIDKLTLTGGHSIWNRKRRQEAVIRYAKNLMEQREAAELLEEVPNKTKRQQLRQSVRPTDTRENGFQVDGDLLDEKKPITSNII